MCTISLFHLNGGVGTLRFFSLILLLLLKTFLLLVCLLNSDFISPIQYNDEEASSGSPHPLKNKRKEGPLCLKMGICSEELNTSAKRTERHTVRREKEEKEEKLALRVCCTKASELMSAYVSFSFFFR